MFLLIDNQVIDVLFIYRVCDHRVSDMKDFRPVMMTRNPVLILFYGAMKLKREDCVCARVK